MTHELDGIYQISTTTSYQGPLEKRSDGQTEIKDGTISPALRVFLLPTPMRLRAYYQGICV